MRRLSLALLAALPVALVSAAAAAASNGGLTPVTPVSPNAQAISQTYWLILAVTGVIFVLVETALIVFIVRFRSRGRTREQEGAQIHGATRLEVASTIVPVLILAGIAAFVFVKLPTIKDVPPAKAGTNPLAITVEGQQFYWKFDYPGGQVAVHRMVVAVGRVVTLTVVSPDVIHSWWVPALGGKIDAIPGRVNHTWFQAEKIGSYEVRCAEFCGLEHAHMTGFVDVVGPATYAHFLATHEGASSALGKEVFEGVCATCHGFQGQGSYGPKLIGNAILADPKTVEQLLRHGKNKMPAVGANWSQDTMTAATTYLKQRFAGGARVAARAEAQPYRADWKRGRVTSWITTVDHKRIGILYIITSLVFFAIGGLLSLFMRAQLATPNEHFVTGQRYNQLFTIHGTTMVFLVVVPILAGFGNYLVPLMIGARDMAFPRLNAFSYWMFLFGGVVLYSSFFAKGGPASAGWTSYPPLSEGAFSKGNGQDLWILSLHILAVASLAGAINLIATIHNMRTPGMTWTRMPLFVWSMEVYAAMLVVILPVIGAGLLLLLLDRQVGTHFFIPSQGGSALLYQHIFWFFGHPEVYVIILPAMGMISEIIPVFARKPIFGYKAVAFSSIGIAFISMLVWAHHMFTVGLGWGLQSYFMIVTMLVAIPTGVKILNWLATTWKGNLLFDTPMLFALGFIAIFTIGGLTGIYLAAFPLDWQVHDSYFVVAHFHYTLFGGAIFAIFGGMHYWWPKMFGRLLNEKLGKWTFWTMFVGFNVTFMPQHFLGLMGMPRRVYTYDQGGLWETYNLISTIGSGIMTVGVLLFFINVIRTSRKGARAGNDPWLADTLEWYTSSPPPPENFTEDVPYVTSPRPLRDLRVQLKERNGS